MREGQLTNDFQTKTTVERVNGKNVQIFQIPSVLKINVKVDVIKLTLT